eukprot:TRINITY_DN5744_c0_g2_i2.p1 TRINITY_DN5744_c0_g2~~TRINITY_DN5744_c0_g2_i2.p1  ORF type:complete len:560 (-),score=78.35 TRINITY_DN5744_c0_g2_i2:157-1836(-)
MERLASLGNEDFACLPNTPCYADGALCGMRLPAPPPPAVVARDEQGQLSELMQSLFDTQLRDIKKLFSQQDIVIRSVHEILRERSPHPPEVRDSGVILAKRRINTQVPALINNKSLASRSTHFNKAYFRNEAFMDPKAKAKKPSLAKEGEGNIIAKLLKSSYFDQCVAVVLCAYAVFIGVQVQSLFSAPETFAIQVIDHIFGALFVIELVARLCAFGCSMFIRGADRSWNCFDAFVVGLSSMDLIRELVFSSDSTLLADITLLRIIRVTRVARVLRVIRVMKFFRELRVLVSAIFSTLKTAVWALALVVLTMYIFGVGLAQMTADYLNEQPAAEVNKVLFEQLLRYYGSLPMAIHTLFMAICGGIDWEIAFNPLMLINPLANVLFLCYITFSYFCLTNVIIGIFCQNAVEAFERDRDKVIEAQMNEKHRFVNILATLFASAAGSSEGTLSFEQFTTLCKDREMIALLGGLDVEVRDAITLFKMVDDDCTGEVDLDEFVTGCIALRGGAKAFHLERAYVETKKLTKRVTGMQEMLQIICSALLCPQESDVASSFECPTLV